VTAGRRARRRPRRARPVVVAVLAALALAACSDGDDPSPPPRSMPPAQPAALRLLVTSDDRSPSRVYEAPGQIGTQPRFVARPGQGLWVRVDNQDAYLHSFALPQASVDLNARPHAISTSRQVRAPTTPGVYRFFCRFAQGTMNGELVVTGSPVDTPERQPPHDPLLLLPSHRPPDVP
jgi:heme/copper-type cytochrome/quinol oxidase subunit 2